MGADHDRRPERTLADLQPPVPAEPAYEEQPAHDQRPVPGLATPLRRRGDPLGGTTVDPHTAARLVNPSGGSALPDTVRGPLESAFGADFSGVRVHHDAGAADLSAGVGAKAFTHGNDIYFSHGSFDPSSSQGQHLLAHELTHVVQQQQGRDRGASGTAPTIGRADDPLEAEADRTAGSVLGALRRHAEAGAHTPAEETGE